jgi:hypothetical protein
MKLRNILAVLAGGAVAFIWSTVSWMVIPWHQPTMSAFEDEASVGQAIKEAAPAAGIYTYPAWTEDAEEMQKKHNEGPYVFASVVPSGVGSEMGSMMLGGFLANLVGAALLLTLMLCVPDAGWKARTLVAAVAALFVSLVPALMNWNWWHFPLPFTLVAIVDGFIGWTLAGFVMAKLTAYRPNRQTD